MGGLFGVISRKNCKYEVFFGTDYHSHLGTKRGGIALETQYYPDSVNHSDWPQPFVKAGQRYHTETCYTFK